MSKQTVKKPLILPHFVKQDDARFDLLKAIQDGKKISRLPYKSNFFSKKLVIGNFLEYVTVIVSTRKFPLTPHKDTICLPSKVLS